MKIDEFANVIKVLVEDAIGEGYQVMIDNITKNNGIKLVGLTIKGEKEKISPTIHIDSIYEDYKHGKIKIPAAAEKVLSIYKNHKYDKSFDASVITDIAKCKEHIFYKLVNAEKNKELLENVPHKIVCEDLAVIFYVLLYTTDDSAGSTIINNEIIDKWDVKVDQLYDLAIINTQKLFKEKIMNMSNVIDGLMSGKKVRNIEDSDDINAESMYVCTNEKAMNGAGVILYKDLLKRIADKIGNDLYIIPSSVHEVIIIPALEIIDVNMLKSMVPDVNMTEVKSTEVLSDHVYVYHKVECKITLA